jgi:BASS family bile acid:Na+ symporter
MTGAYLAALIIMPLVMVYFLGAELFNPMQLVIILVELVLAPLLVSRILLYFGLSRYIQRWRGIITNWSFFIVVFTLIGLNREAFLSDFGILFRISIVAIATTFGLGYLIEVVAKAIHLKYKRRSAILMD